MIVHLISSVNKVPGEGFYTRELSKSILKFVGGIFSLITEIIITVLSTDEKRFPNDLF